MPWHLYLALPRAVPPPHPPAADSSLAQPAHPCLQEFSCRRLEAVFCSPLLYWQTRPNFVNIRIFPSQWKKQKFSLSVKFVTMQTELKKEPVPHLTANLSECLSCTPLLYIQGRQRDIIDETFCLWSVYVLLYFTCFCNIDNRLHHRAFIALCYKDTIKPFWVLIIDCVDEFGEAGNRPPTAKTLTPQD